MYKKFYDKYMKDFKLPADTDEYRLLYANNDVGVDFSSDKTLGIIFGMDWDLIKQFGKKIISDDFNLTIVTIQIKVMEPISTLINKFYLIYLKQFIGIFLIHWYIPS